MAEEGAELHHLHLLAAGGAEPLRLEERGGGDEGLVVPEPNGVRDGGVALGEEVLELVDLEEVGDGVVAAVLAPRALPPLVADLLLRLLDLGLPRPRRQHQRDRAAHQHRHRRHGQRPEDDLVPRPPLHPGLPLSDPRCCSARSSLESQPDLGRGLDSGSDECARDAAGGRAVAGDLAVVEGEEMEINRWQESVR